MDLRNKIKQQAKNGNASGEKFYQNQSFADTAVNALEQKTLLDIDSEP